MVVCFISASGNFWKEFYDRLNLSNLSALEIFTNNWKEFVEGMLFFYSLKEKKNILVVVFVALIELLQFKLITTKLSKTMKLSIVMVSVFSRK